MQKLTSLALILALVWAAPIHAADAPDRSAAVDAFVKTQPRLANAATAAADADAAAAVVRQAARAKLGPLQDGEVVVALIAVSDALGGEDRYADALRVGEFAVAITRRAGLEPGLLFDSLARTGGMRYQLDDFDGAGRDLDAARQAAAQITPFDANSVANATANYAVILDQAGRYREAEAELRAAIALRAQAAEQRPTNTAVAWFALAAVHKRMGRRDLAEQDYRTGLTLIENAGQTANPSYGLALHNYGVLMGDLGRDAEAVALYQRAIAIRPADTRHAPSMVNNYTSLAAALMGLEQLDAAEAAVRDAEQAAAGKSKPDSASINVISARANLAGRRGDHAAAERYAATAVAQTRTIVAPTSIQLAEVLATWSDALRRNGKPAAARIAADEAVGITAALADRNPLKAVAQDTRAAALASDAAPVQALAASRIAAEIQARRFAEESGRTPAPLQPEERGIMFRRMALLWDAGQAR